MKISSPLRLSAYSNLYKSDSYSFSQTSRLMVFLYLRAAWGDKLGAASTGSDSGQWGRLLLSAAKMAAQYSEVADNCGFSALLSSLWRTAAISRLSQMLLGEARCYLSGFLYWWGWSFLSALTRRNWASSLADTEYRICLREQVSRRQQKQAWYAKKIQFFRKTQKVQTYIPQRRISRAKYFLNTNYKVGEQSSTLLEGAGRIGIPKL